MTVLATTRRIDLTKLAFPASQRWDGTAGEVEADRPLAELQAAVAAAPDDNSQANQSTINDRLDQALAAMQTIIDTPDLAAGTLTAAQLSTAARQLQTAAKAEARLLKNVVRHLRATYNAVD